MCYPVCLPGDGSANNPGMRQQAYTRVQSGKFASSAICSNSHESETVTDHRRFSRVSRRMLYGVQSIDSIVIPRNRVNGSWRACTPILARCQQESYQAENDRQTETLPHTSQYNMNQQLYSVPTAHTYTHQTPVGQVLSALKILFIFSCTRQGLFLLVCRLPGMISQEFSQSASQLCGNGNWQTNRRDGKEKSEYVPCHFVV